MISDEECDFRRGYVHGMMNMVEAIFHEKAKKEEIEDYLMFMMEWRYSERIKTPTGEPPCIGFFREEMRKRRESGS